MTNSFWTHPRVRRVKFGKGGGGGGWVEWVVAALLAIIIVSALVVTLWPESTVGGSSVPKVYYKCTACDHVFDFEMTEQYYMELARNADFVIPNRIGPVVVMDCPDCGAEQKALPAVVCPNPDCREVYIPTQVQEAWELHQQGYGSDSEAFRELGEMPVTCPFCGKDYEQMLTEHGPATPK